MVGRANETPTTRPRIKAMSAIMIIVVTSSVIMIILPIYIHPGDRFALHRRIQTLRIQLFAIITPLFVSKCGLSDLLLSYRKGCIVT